MFGTVELPVWLFTLIMLFALVTFSSHFFIPPVRWFFRRRMEKAVEELNKRLQRPIQPFKLARRHDTIQRLIYDPQVIAAVARHAQETGVREDVAFSEAKRYAREIVPSFSASAYFGFAIRAARMISRLLFHVRLVREDEEALAAVDPDATVVYVMNHRSNMDYVLVTYLAADRSALSYAVGEWARIWPLSWLFRAMGAYFIRRTSRNKLYRRVLARYVQLAVENGVTQAIFPEGGLSLTGRVGEAKLGLMSYIVQAGRESRRNVVFVPVALNYDRVIEDRILIEAGQSGERQFRGSFLTGTAFALRWLGHRVTGRARRFGYAAVAFGTPLKLDDVMEASDGSVTGIAAHLMSSIRRHVPVLPVPMVAAAIQDGATSRAEIRSWVSARLPAWLEADVPVHLRRGSVQDSVDAGVDMLILRHLATQSGDGTLSPTAKGEPVIGFYAASLPLIELPMRTTAPVCGDCPTEA
ncbi:1-acyl-sn-glycerol-3-phosphate acyltransferase [Palleronia sp. LCG004]|uniref:1-acyl-sn-glycerol-3-phosphate acyltransferase n=1 Tax=Palleronia sp. LCG004 TaxID=3079304 RepID=UPI002942D518|nr:1-acyl-sn-glycerol-3-phosphate acyltransferase [Palleronia sp. LCG004]WOI56917.1 1-acyl-sn-glycerol-3-phosphate acyltransferase [Palleronia sp. LCG004]